MVQHALRDLCGFKNLEWYANNYQSGVTSFDIRKIDYEVESSIKPNDKIATVKN